MQVRYLLISDEDTSAKALATLNRTYVTRNLC